MESSPAPDVYTDQMMVVSNLFGSTITFMKSNVAIVDGQLQVQPPSISATVRMSLEHTKLMTMILHKYLKGWEEKQGEIPITDDLLSAQGLEKADW